MATQVDALSSFVFLTENLPKWITQMADLSNHASKRHGEFAAEYSRLLKHARPKKVKSPSLHSHRSSQALPENEGTAAAASTPSTTPVEINPLEAGTKYLLANVSKREKLTGASVRSGASGPRRSRQKQAVVVYYDSHVQTSLEAMVKNISTARNNLRKGKKTRDLANGPMLPLLASFDSALKRNPYMTQIIVDSKPGKQADTNEAKPNIDRCFELADKTLERAQGLCEVAAHQFLRDGDNCTELKQITEHMRTVLVLAKTTTEQLKEEEQTQSADPDVAEITVNEGIDHRLDYLSSRRGAFPKTTGPQFIEVDDDDDGSTILSNIERGTFDIKRYQPMLRTSRAPA